MRHGKSLSSLKHFLLQARDVIDSLDLDLDAARSALDELIQRLDSQKFHLAVLGQFKRGKSTLINALLGEPLLPTSVVPLTAIPTMIEFGEQHQVVAHYSDKADDEVFNPGSVEQACQLLAELVTEKGNPKNKRGIERVVLRAPCSLLRHQVVLIDTPGVGSTNVHNTSTTRDFLSQCDAAIFVVSADPPLTQQEAGFLSQVQEHVARIFFVMNKVDYLQDKQVVEALDFFRQALAESCAIEDPGIVFCVSARLALQARLKGDQTEFSASGLHVLEEHLEDFLLGDKVSVLCEAIGTKARAQVSDVLMQLEFSAKSARMPLDKLEKSLGIFDEKIGEIQTQRQIADDRLDGDERRAVAYLETEMEKLRTRTAKHLNELMQDIFRQMDEGKAKESLLSESLAKEVPGYFQHALTDMAHDVSSYIQGVLNERRDETDDLIVSIRKAAADIFDIPYRAPSASSVFKIDSRIYWDTHKWTPSYSPLPEGSLDRLLPARQRRRRLEKRWYSQVQALVEQNAETLRWEILQGLKKAFWSYRSSLDKRLSDTLYATHGAIRSALQRRKSHQEQVAGFVDKIDEAIAVLNDWMNSQPL